LAIFEDVKVLAVLRRWHERGEGGSHAARAIFGGFCATIAAAAVTIDQTRTTGQHGRIVARLTIGISRADSSWDHRGRHVCHARPCATMRTMLVMRDHARHARLASECSASMPTGQCETWKIPAPPSHAVGPLSAG
jgi:hypothetical protein